MKKTLVSRTAESACSRVGRATQSAGTFLATIWLLLAVTFAVFVPATLEQRIGYSVFVGLVPAFGLYVCGHILRQMVDSSCKLCEIIMARCVLLLTPFANALVSWVSSFLLDALDKCSMIIAGGVSMIGRCMQTMIALGQKIYFSVHCWYRYVREAIFESCCWLIRSFARMVIRMQHKLGG